VLEKLKFVVAHPTCGAQRVRFRLRQFFQVFHKHRVHEYRRYLREPDAALASIIGISPLSARRPETLSQLQKHLSFRMRETPSTPFTPRGISDAGNIDSVAAEVLYFICRVVRPTLVVETGVANGVSSAHILQALEDNARGHLYSIDVPPITLRAIYPREIGWAIPDSLRCRWTLLVGESRDNLASLLNVLGKIDMFIHDSDHSYHNQLLEFRTAWPHLVDGGLLLADDVINQDALLNFCDEIRREPIIVNRRHGLAIVRK